MSSPMSSPMLPPMSAVDVALFVPNLIGYCRVALALISFFLMPYWPGWAMGTYFLSAFLDAFDGHAARMLEQSSRFGAMLDQLTDRCGTMGLVATLCSFYPRLTPVLVLAMVIDISCHWVHLHTSLLSGQSSHKFMDAGAHPLMKLYYTNKSVLFGMCAGNESFYIALYLLHFYDNGILYYLVLFVLVITLPVAVAKLAIAALQGFIAFVNLANVDAQERNRKSAAVDLQGKNELEDDKDK